jgi:hypothetical protein
MDKVIKDGKVAVLISYGYGAGFHSWGAPLEAIFDPKLVELVESEDFDGANEYVRNTYPGVYTGGVGDLVVVWVDEGEDFIINEYDGSEGIQLKNETQWITA